MVFIAAYANDLAAFIATRLNLNATIAFTKNAGTCFPLVRAHKTLQLLIEDHLLKRSRQPPMTGSMLTPISKTPRRFNFIGFAKYSG